MCITVLFSTFISVDHFSRHIYFLPAASIIPLPKHLQLDITNFLTPVLANYYSYIYVGHAIHGGSKLHAMQRGQWGTLLDETTYIIYVLSMSMLELRLHNSNIHTYIYIHPTQDL